MGRQELWRLSIASIMVRASLPDVHTVCEYLEAKTARTNDRTETASLPEMVLMKVDVCCCGVFTSTLKSVLPIVNVLIIIQALPFRQSSFSQLLVRIMTKHHFEFACGGGGGRDVTSASYADPKAWRVVCTVKGWNLCSPWGLALQASRSFMPKPKAVDLLVQTHHQYLAFVWTLAWLLFRPTSSESRISSSPTPSTRSLAVTRPTILQYRFSLVFFWSRSLLLDFVRSVSKGLNDQGLVE